jgi:enterochelin esterase-like enzyme
MVLGRVGHLRVEGSMPIRWLMLAVGAIPLSSLPVSGQPIAASAVRNEPWVTPAVRAPRVSFRTFESRAVGGPVSYHVFIPAAYDQPDVRLPVLYWLHGTVGGVVGIRPMARFFDEAIEAGSLPPMLVVFVNGLPRRLWADSKDGGSPVETVFITEVIPDVDRQFRTLARREGRILEGFSMGGYGAARLGFKHPELFAGISILAGGPFDLELRGPRASRNPRLRQAILRDVCSGDIDYFEAISPWRIAETAAGALRETGMVVRQVVGGRDESLELNRRFHDRMTELGVEHDYAELPDVDHDARGLLAALGADNGTFYRRALESSAPAALPASGNGRSEVDDPGR